MKSIVTGRDMGLMGGVFAETAADRLPISFTYNGVRHCGLGAEFAPEVRVERPDSRMIKYIFTGREPLGLCVRAEMVKYTDYAGWELIAFFENGGDEALPILEDVKIFDGVIAGDGLKLIHGNGDTLRDDGYEWSENETDQPIAFSPADGTSCNGAFPYMRLQGGDFGYNVAVGWPAMWKAEFAPAQGGVHVAIGQKRCHAALRPGEIMRTPRVNVLAYEGDAARGTNMWRRWYFDHIMPRQNGRALQPKLCLHVFGAEGKPEFTGANEENQTKGLWEYLEKGLKPDVWWVDAGWYKCDYDWPQIGTWEFDAERFPRGLAPVGDICDEHGIDLMLWFEPERARPGTRLVEEHPEWMLKWTQEDGSVHQNSLVNLGDKDCCDHMIENIDRIIKQSHVRIYRQDFNFDPKPYWAEAETEDRIGMVENLHVQGYLRLWDTLLERNPGLIIDSCASGGRRNDLETMRRAVPFHYTDVGYGEHTIKQKQHWQMFGWIPYFRAHNKNWDDPETGIYDGKDRPQDRFAYYVAMTPALTDVIEHDACEEEFALAREMTGIWRRAAELMLEGDYYPLTECRKSREDYYAVQFHNPDSKSGFFEVVRNIACAEDSFKARLRALDNSVLYELTEAETGEKSYFSGKALSEGMNVAIPKRSGRIYFYRAID